ncbi:MAG: hypothetical protein HYY40_12845 [Bacteroidetes bacterium]|nr:hypothetical protein [Bacteroidota bacterium]
MVYFFIHTPKTSGTTFVDILSKDKNNLIGYFYPSRREVYDFEQTIKNAPYKHLKNNPDWRKFRFIAGHFTFGMHEIFKTDQFKYLTVFRNPMHHYFSTYRAFLRMPDPYKRHLLPDSSHFSIEDFTGMEYSHNLQTFFLSGLSHSDIRRDKENAFDVTVQNIEKYFAGIFPTERFDAGLFYLKQKIGIKPEYYRRKNIGTNYLKPETFFRVRNRITEVNDVDFRIYRYICKRFNEEIKRIPGFTRDLWRFKIFNYFYKTGFLKS